MRGHVEGMKAKITEVRITCSTEAARELAKIIDEGDRKWASSVTVELDRIASGIHTLLKNPTMILRDSQDGVIASNEMEET